MSNPPIAPAQRYRATLRASISRHWAPHLAQGVLLMATGGLAAVHALMSFSLTTAVLLACALIASAALQLVNLWLTKQLPYFSIQLVSVASLLIIGLVLVRQGQVGSLNPQYLVVIFLVVDNLSRLIFGFAIRPLSGWWLMVASSVLGLGMAAMLFQDVPNASPLSIALIAGANFFATGLATALIAWLSRKP